MKRIGGPQRTHTIIVGFVCMIALVLAMGLQIRPFTYLWVSLYTAVAVAVLVLSLTARLEKHAEEEQAKALDAQADLRRLSASLLESQEQERQALSRELHDQIGQALTAIKIDLSRAEQALDPKFAPIHERLTRARWVTEETLEKVRSMSMLLRPSMLDDIGLNAALGWYAKRFSQNTGIRVALSDEESVESLPASHKSSLYRVVQEALTNCARHSEARNVQIRLGLEDGICRLTIEDDGKGFEPHGKPRGLGLLGIQERVDEMGGTLELVSSPGRGTTLAVTVPLKQEQKVSNTV
jgi:signal transduction histidine kinase